MAKILPETFPFLALNRFQVGQPIRASDYSTMVERSHYLWAIHRGRCTGWNWIYDAVAFNDLTNDAAGQPEIEDYQPVLLANRVTESNQIQVGVRAFLRFAQINVTVYRLAEGQTAPTQVATFSVTNDSGDWDWAQTSVNINAASVTVSGEIVPLLFTFSVAAPTIDAPQIRRIQPYEAGILDLAFIGGVDAGEVIAVSPTSVSSYGELET